jgi:hypothetical protein
MEAEKKLRINVFDNSAPNTGYPIWITSSQSISEVILKASQVLWNNQSGKILFLGGGSQPRFFDDFEANEKTYLSRGEPFFDAIKLKDNGISNEMSVLRREMDELQHMFASSQFTISNTIHIAEKVLPLTLENIDAVMEGLVSTTEINQLPQVLITPASEQSEQYHQTQITKLYDKLLLHTKLTAHDTSKSGLTDPNAKIDHTITRKGYLYLWPEIVLVSEVKKDIKREHNDAFGQVIDRIIHLFKKQPRRTIVYGILIDCFQIEIIKVKRTKEFNFWRTGIQQLFTDSAHCGPGYNLLVRLFNTPLENLGFSPLLLPQTPCKFLVAHSRLPHQEFILDSALEVIHEGAIKHAHICKFVSSDINTTLILKYSQNKSEIENELAILSKLNHENIIKLFAHGPVIDNSYLGLILKPFGQVVSSMPYPNINKILHNMDQINSALVYSHNNGICHRDVSPKNIIVHENKAILIDWGIAKPHGEAEFEFTGTALFCSINCHSTSQAANFNFQYHPRDDFESLFYSLIYLVKQTLNQKLPWISKKTDDDIRNSKISSMYFDWENLMNGVDKNAMIIINQMHNKLFCTKEDIKSLF